MGIIFTRIELSVLKLLVVVIITGGWSISLMSSKQIDFIAVSRMSIEARSCFLGWYLLSFLLKRVGYISLNRSGLKII